MKTKIIFIRHGESVANKKGLLAGRFDLGLTEQGEEQAQLVANALKTAGISTIYASSLPRALKTASYTAKECGLEVVSEDGFMEIWCGEMEGKVFDEEISNPILLDYVENFVTGAFPGGETVKQVALRFYESAERVAKRHEGETIAVATHAAALASFISLIRADGNLDDMQYVEFTPNCALTTVTYENGKFEIEKYGAVDHLNGNITKFDR